MSAVLAGETPVSKGEFAKLINVSPGRVSQLIAEGKIHGPALAGEGRMAKIRAEVAKAQLRQSLDISQRLGNGIETRLDAVAIQTALPIPAQQAEAAAPAPQALTEDFSIEGQIKREKLKAAQFQNRRFAEEEQARRGRFIETTAARNQMTTLASTMVQTFEGALADFASAISGKFKVPQRDVLFLLTAEFRHVRAKAAVEAARRASETPDAVESPVEAEA